MDRLRWIRPIVVYRIEHHPLDLNEDGAGFPWIGPQDDLRAEIEELIGPFDADDVTFLLDKHPAGPGWRQLLLALIDERLRMVITHLAPLSSAQRQQLIGLCAQGGAQLITPGDAGRNQERAPKVVSNP